MPDPGSFLALMGRLQAGDDAAASAVFQRFARHHQTGAKTAEANQELFVFRRSTDGRWKIARYSFSTINPPPQQ